jgi:hypothetical protein
MKVGTVRNTTNYLEKATKEPAMNFFVENLLIAKSPRRNSDSLQTPA